MPCRVAAFCGLTLVFVAGGFAARAQTTTAQIPSENGVAAPSQPGGTKQAAPTPPRPSQPNPPAPPLAARPAAAAAAPAAKAPAAPSSAIVASPPTQPPVANAPQAAASSAAEPASKGQAATVNAPPPTTPAPVVVKTPMPPPKPAMLKAMGKGRHARALLVRSLAGEQSSHVPAWLKAHVGVGEGQIAQVVLQRARALYQQKVREGAVENPCYFAMDATRPNDLSHDKLGRRFYVICESERVFRAIPAGHGSGRNLKGIANFKNGRRCVKNFGNALDSKLTTGGAYVTGEIRTSFEGYYRASARRDAALIRSFIQFDGEGDTANAQQRAIGGHAAVLLRGICLRKDPESLHANHKGYVPFGKLVNYIGGRSNGCTSWSRSDARRIVAMVKDDPTTLYIYPDAADIDAVAQAVKAGRSLSRAGLYWNASCLKEIGSPKFWPKETLGPILAKYKKDHPAPPRRPIPICRGPSFLRKANASPIRHHARALLRRMRPVNGPSHKRHDVRLDSAKARIADLTSGSPGTTAQPRSSFSQRSR